MLWRKRKPGDFQAEIDAHIQLEADELRAQGRTPDDARFAARRAFGNRTAAEEQFYESGRWMLFEHLLRDVRFAARVLAKDLRFSVLAILGLALGIGVSAAVFTLVLASVQANDDPPSYVRIFRVIEGRPIGDFSLPEYQYLRDHATTLQSFRAQSGRNRFILSPLANGGEAEEVSGRFEDGTPVTLGRSFQREEARSGAAPVVLLDFRFWKRRFSADPGVLGRTVVLNARVLTIVGVADARHGAADTSDFYLPLGLQSALLRMNPADPWLMAGAVLRSGEGVERAQAEMNVLGSDLLRSAPARPGEGGVLVSPGGTNPERRKEMLAAVLAITIAVSMILLIACSNLANLLLARAAVRRREIGVRLSLGASRARLVCQLLTESMLLAMAGGGLGLLFSHWLAQWLLVALNAPPGLSFDLRIEPRVILYSLILSVATGLTFGLAPALAATRTNLAEALHGQALSKNGPPRRLWSARNLLVIAPLAISLMLLLGAGIAVRRVQSSYLDGPALETSRLIGMSFRLNMQGYDEPRTLRFQESLRERIAGMPGVRSVALATSMPLLNAVGWFPLRIEGAASLAHADYNVVSPEFFQTVGANVVRGRGFASSDRRGGQPVALVNQEFARQYWPNEESIGKRICLPPGSTFFEVVGVAPDFEDAGRRFNWVRPTVYIPYAQAGALLDGPRVDPPPYQVGFLVRAAGDPSPVKAALRQAARAADPSLQVTVQTFDDILETRLGPVKTMSLLLSSLGALALVMASVGIYAILAFAVSQRTREIGIRMALGARRSEILGLVMQRTALLIVWGIGLGLAGALALTRILARSLSKLGHLDAATCVTVSLALAIVALLASYLPARKAFRVDPAQSLRSE